MGTFLSYGKFVFNINFEISDLEKEYVALSNDLGGKIEILLQTQVMLKLDKFATCAFTTSTAINN